MARGHRPFEVYRHGHVRPLYTQTWVNWLSQVDATRVLSSIKCGGTRRGRKNIDYYEIAMRQFMQQVLSAGLPATTVWGYGTRTAAGELFSAPSATIEAKVNTSAREVDERTDRPRRACTPPSDWIQRATAGCLPRPTWWDTLL